MSQYRTIEIDIDVHKAIQLERRDFDETDNEALRRLLRLPTQSPLNAPTEDANKSSWVGKRVTLPHGTALKMSYNGQEYKGAIVDGEWVVNGKTFRSPSEAAKGVAITRSGEHTSLNGWQYWQVKFPGHMEWEPLESLRHGRILASISDAELDALGS